MANKIQVLWADDEIDLLKPYILYLEDKGYEVIPVHSGNEAIDVLNDRMVDIVFVDEKMPGLSGLDTIVQIKNKRNSLPIVMITKSEEESIMESAIGSNISDYLVKPVQPLQILHCLKNNGTKPVPHSVLSEYQNSLCELLCREQQGVN